MFCHISGMERLAYVTSEGTKKTTRGEVNGSKLKFVMGTWPMSQFRSNVGHRNWVRNHDHSKSLKRCKQGYVRDFGKSKLNQPATQNLMHIPPNTWCAWLRVHHKNTMRTQKAWAFDLATQEQYRLSPATIQTQSENSKWLFHCLINISSSTFSYTRRTTVLWQDHNRREARWCELLMRSVIESRPKWTRGQNTCEEKSV
jgi:hypothetical protein